MRSLLVPALLLRIQDLKSCEVSEPANLRLENLNCMNSLVLSKPFEAIQSHVGPMKQ